LGFVVLRNGDLRSDHFCRYFRERSSSRCPHWRLKIPNDLKSDCF
jgi:hypothetical protein